MFKVLLIAVLPAAIIFFKMKKRYQHPADRAMRFYGEGNYSMALKLLQQTKEKNGFGDGHYYTLLGKCYEETGDKEKARRCYTIASETGTAPKARLALMDMKIYDSPEEYENEITDVLKSYPHTPGVLLRQASLYRETGREELAEGCLKTLLEREPLNGWALDRYIDLCFDTQNYTLAEKLIKKAVISDHPDALEYLSRLKITIRARKEGGNQ